MTGHHAVPAAVLAGCLVFAHCTASADAAAGKRLAAERCAVCHASTSAGHSTVPLLEGQPRTAFLSQWRDFRERRRSAPVMVSLAQELDEKQVGDLADYYAALLPPGRASPGSDAGRALADRLKCAGCHGPALQGTDAGAARLAGQKERYTSWSLHLMRSGVRAHGSAAKPDPLLAGLGNDEIESLAAHFASLR